MHPNRARWDNPFCFGLYVSRSRIKVSRKEIKEAARDAGSRLKLTQFFSAPFVAGEL
ncbi:hypothetical protein Z948_2878 [Sulfitobacter donghicola DSW-25 = KCTC 12864 = JCM 14565]|nr:hypothetical protein Z948_2878 [Sulfitobacter donghicola DSW-25 = KCTC 12864 = JCM 14565]